MLRDKNLVPLSRQHQHALALCVRIDRASPIPDSDLATWLAEITQHFRSEIAVHFSAEEQILFPPARRFPELRSMVDELLSDHVWLRAQFSQAESGNSSASQVSAFGKRLSEHIRKEERQLFERLQKVLSQKELDRLGARLDQALTGADESCILPNEATKLRPAKGS